jgi:hypothetical protein
VVGRVCEEFHVTPAAAVRLLDEDGDRVLAIMDLRSYKRAYDVYQQFDAMDDKAKRKLEADPLVKAVKLADFELRAGRHGDADD